MLHSGSIARTEGGRERIWSIATEGNVIQISVEKKLEVDEAERYRKSVPDDKNPNVGTHQFRGKSPAWR